MRHLEALKEARDTYARRENLDRQQKVDAAVSLGEWGIFSGRHIAQFTALDPATVNKLISNPDRNGGRLSPEAIPTIIEIIFMRQRSEIDTKLVRKAVEQGTSVNFLAKLTGTPQRTMARWVDKGFSA
jgi:hypothetical protein